jgi:aryl-alcohol dehydrogenase-like predicted oxidoreductase
MEIRQFGNTKLRVSVLGYGAMALRNVDAEQSERLLNAVLDHGINFIDTAPDYGHSEDMIGRYIAHRRDEYVLATKCGCNVPREGDSNAPGHIWTAAQLRHNIEHSLKRLKTDVIDVWQIHSADPSEVQGTEVMEEMHRIQDEGKVRHIAVSMAGQSEGYGYNQLKGYLTDNSFEAIQVWYSAFIRYSEALIAQAASRGWGTIIRGLVRPPFGSTLDEHFEKSGLDDFREEGESRAQLLIRFGITDRDLHTAIVGTSDLEHLADNVAAAEKGPLSDETLAEMRHRLEKEGYLVGL